MIKAGSNTIGSATIDSSEIVKAYYRGYLVYYKAPEQYIVFADPVVEQICVSNWGDGVGLKPSQAAQVANAQFGTTFRNNTQITSFDELSYFGISALDSSFQNDSALESVSLPARRVNIQNYVFDGCSSLTTVTLNGPVTTTASTYGFRGCSNLKHVNIPDTDTFVDCNFGQNTFSYASHELHLYIDGIEVTSLIMPTNSTSVKNYAFQWCVGLQAINIPSTVTSIGNYAFQGCSGLVNLIIPCGADMRYLASSGNGTGMLYIGGYAAGGTYNAGNHNYKDVIIAGNVTFGGSTSLLINPNVTETLRIYGNYTGNSFAALSAASSSMKFVEINGTVSSYLFYTNCRPSSFILHLGYNGLGMSKPSLMSSSSSQLAATMAACTKIYVGPGESQAGDQAVLDAYLADTDWAAYSSKLDLWYNYTGDYKTPPTIPSQ